MVQLAFSPDGSRLAAGDLLRNLYVADVGQGTVIRRIEDHAESVGAVAFSPDGKLLVSGSSDGTIRLWDVSTFECLNVLDHTGPVLGVRFTPDGSQMSSVHEDGSLRVWNLRQSRKLRVLRGHTGRVWEVIPSPDGRLLYTPSDDGTIRTWDVATGREVRKLAASTGPVTYVDLSSNGKRLVACARGSDGQSVIPIWDAATGERFLDIVQDGRKCCWTRRSRKRGCDSTGSRWYPFDSQVFTAPGPRAA